MLLTVCDWLFVTGYSQAVDATALSADLATPAFATDMHCVCVPVNKGNNGQPATAREGAAKCASSTLFNMCKTKHTCSRQIASCLGCLTRLSTSVEDFPVDTSQWTVQRASSRTQQCTGSSVTYHSFERLKQCPRAHCPCCSQA